MNDDKESNANQVPEAADKISIDADGNNKIKVVNEVSNFCEARWWAPHEAFWRIAGFHVHKQMPPVTRLVVHLQNQQNVFADVNNLKSDAARQQLKANAERTCRS